MLVHVAAAVEVLQSCVCVAHSFTSAHDVIAGDPTPANPKLQLHAEADVLAVDGVVEYCGQLVQAPLPLVAL